MKDLSRRQIASKIEKIQSFRTHINGVPSWIKYMRKALGMTPVQLAERMGIAKSSLHQIERQEALDKVSVQTLKKAADAMGCEFIYAIIPQTSVDDLVDEQAKKRALKILKSPHLQMEYEDEAVTDSESLEQFKELCEKLKSSKKLWESD